LYLQNVLFICHHTEVTLMTYRPAQTIVAIATGTDPDIKVICDRGQALTTDLVDRVIARSQCHYAGRRPKAPTETPTDMDLASYLLALYRRQAVVSLSPYTRLTPQTEPAEARHIGDIRFGEITSLVSHQEYLSFGIRLNDASVIGSDGFTEKVGQARSFTLLAPTGDWHTKPESLHWRERADEAEFNQHHRLSRSDIQSFVHRNRRESVMGSPYLVAKCLLLRLNDEVEHFRRPTYGADAPGVRRYHDVKSEIIPSFTMQVQGFELAGQYAQDICSRVYRKQLYAWRQLVQWLVRINEYAFFRHGLARDYTAPWVRNTAWQHTGEGRARLLLHPNLILTYRLHYVSRLAVAQRVPLVALAQV